MVATIKNVAVVGASGTIGSRILSTLITSGLFNLTALCRESSTATFPEAVRVVRADFSSVDDLAAVLKGQDAVVSAIAISALIDQLPIIEACAIAHVPRFIPSEYGPDMRKNAGTQLDMILAAKFKVLDKLREVQARHEWFSWTALATGNILEFVITKGLVFLHPTDRTARMLDSGDEPFPVTSMSLLARAILAILSSPEQTANKYLCVHSMQTTQNELLDLVQKVQGVEYTVSHADSADVKAAAQDKMAKGDWTALLDAVEVCSYADGANAAFEKVDNDLLGLEKEDMMDMVRELLP